MTYRWIKWALALCLALALALSLAQAEEARDVTDECRLSVNRGKLAYLTDNDYRSRWKCGEKNAKLTVELPEGQKGGWLLIEWNFEPVDFSLSEYDEAGTLIAALGEEDVFCAIYMCLPLSEETVKLELVMYGQNQEVSELRVFAPGGMPNGGQEWLPPVEKADIMFVAAHQDDELLFFGGAIPYYAVAEQRPCVVVWMANCSRPRRKEGLNGLWAMGYANYPDCLFFRDSHVDSIKEGLKLWGGLDNVLTQLVRRIRRYRPEVVVTHGLDGEYGHLQHQITAQYMLTAIEHAADASYDPQSYNQYGAWQVKKLYLHSYEENRMQMDWDTPLAELDGRSPIEVAEIGYAEHESQHNGFILRPHGTYDNSLFGLYFSTVGLDEAGNDFMEHIDSPAPHPLNGQAAAVTAAPQATQAAPDPTQAPAVTPTPAPELTETPTAQPTAVPVPSAPPAQKAKKPLGFFRILLRVLLIALLGFAAVTGVDYWRREQARKKRMAKRRAARAAARRRAARPKP